MKKMKPVILFLIICVLLGQTGLAAPVSTVIAPTYFLKDMQSGNVLVEENCMTNVKPGDFSKIMTAVLAAETFSAADVVSFQQDSLLFYNTFGNIANVKEGYTLTILQHLQNMLLLYSDASANALAIQVSGSLDDFTVKMNEKAAELGLKDTFFSSPSGYDANNVSKTTVNDLAALTAFAMNQEVIREVVKTERFDLPPVKEGGKAQTYSSRNHLISKYTYTTYTYSPANGFLHSFSKDTASIIATGKKGDKELMAIIINSPDNKNMTVYKDAINLLEYGFNKFYPRLVSQEDDIIAQVKVLGGSQPDVVLVCDSSQKALLPIDYDASKIEKTVQASKEVWAPVQEGQVLGTMTVSYDGKFVRDIDLVAGKSVSFNVFAWFERAVLAQINSVGVFFFVLIAVVVLILIYNSKKKQENRKKRKREIMRHSDQ